MSARFRFYLSLLWVLATAPFSLQAGQTLDCLRDLMPLTEQGNYQAKRQNVESPFFVEGGYLVFPHVVQTKLIGFFFYKGDQAWHYDSVKGKKGVLTPIQELKFSSQKGILQLVAQPQGLETVTLEYLPGYNPREYNKDGPVVLGTSVLPVIGALVSRPNQAQFVYQNPKLIAESRIKAWMHENMTGRRPASAGEVMIQRTLLHMATRQQLPTEKLMLPLREELKLRQNWIKKSNLDEATFRKLNLALKTSCKE